MDYKELNEAVRALKTVYWNETAFADLQWHYCEERLYALRCKAGTENEHICLLRAGSADEAIAKAVFDLHKATREEVR